ncbi:restriction endonuclease [Enterococcus sp. 2201sp1_2201st1_B8_2201SCRN_220225]|uniref:restriction endonuclease n=1 Tax=unclassified Enterococcus TaxID=2608891 RepID=UPI0034A262FA
MKESILKDLQKVIRPAVNKVAPSIKDFEYNRFQPGETEGQRHARLYERDYAELRDLTEEIVKLKQAKKILQNDIKKLQKEFAVLDAYWDYRWELEVRRLDKMTGLEFESYIADMLFYRGFKEISVTKSSGDQGVDVIGQKDGLSYGFQCKLFKGSVTNKAVQEVYTGCGVYDLDKGVVVSTGTFTKSAKEAAEKVNVELWDRMDIREMIKDKVSFENGTF